MALLTRRAARLLPPPSADFGGRFASLAKSPRAPREILGEMIRLIDDLLAKGGMPPQAAARLEELRADVWDAQIAEDAKSGALQKAFAAKAAATDGDAPLTLSSFARRR